MPNSTGRARVGPSLAPMSLNGNTRTGTLGGFPPAVPSPIVPRDDAAADAAALRAAAHVRGDLRTDSVSEAPLIRFSAYASRHRIFGWVRLRADRLTDLLNTHDALLLSDVDIENLEDGTRHSSEMIQVATRGLWPCTLRVRAATRPSVIGRGRMPLRSGPAPTSSRATCTPSRAPIRSRDAASTRDGPADRRLAGVLGERDAEAARHRDDRGQPRGRRLSSS